MGEPRGTLFAGEGDSISLLQGSQVSPARPSDRCSVKVKML
jgi:hypothetical protein